MPESPDSLLGHSRQSPYPEHDKLAAVAEQSQTIGEFIDFGMPRMNLAVWEEITRPCECSWCERGAGLRSAWHTEEEKETIVKGVIQVTEWQPTYRTIERILADYFGIDRAKITAEKEAMLEALRAV